MKKVFSLLCAFCCGWMLWNCTPADSVSPIPEIHFKKLVFLDSLDKLNNIVKYAVLTFSFIDGNGDLGDRYGNGVSRIEYIWGKKLPDGKYEQYEFRNPKDTTIIQIEKIPYRDVMNKDEAQNKILKGTIDVKLSTPWITPTDNPQEADTMRVEFYIFDRARNKSNVEYTPDFSILNPPDLLLNDSHLVQ